MAAGGPHVVKPGRAISGCRHAKLEWLDPGCGEPGRVENQRGGVGQIGTGDGDFNGGAALQTGRKQSIEPGRRQLTVRDAKERKKENGRPPRSGGFQPPTKTAREPPSEKRGASRAAAPAVGNRRSLSTSVQ